MSKKILNKLIEAKFRQVLQLQQNDDISKFDDNSALNIIFATYEDRIEFQDANFGHILNQLQDLKMIQCQLRCELKISRSKEVTANFQPESLQLNNEMNYHLLSETVFEQQKSITNLNEAKREVEVKLLEQIQNKAKYIKESQDFQRQMEAQKDNVKNLHAQMETLREEKKNVILQYGMDMEKCKKDFLQDLVKNLQNQRSKENQINLRLIHKLQSEIQQQGTNLASIIQKVSDIFKITKPKQNQKLSNWLRNVEQVFESYRSEIKRATQKEISESSNPIRAMAQQQRKKIVARSFALSNFINIE